MARRRLGSTAVRRLASAPTLGAARAQLAGTAYARAAADAGGLAEVQRAVASAVLWQIRVLAGWMPPSGPRLARALVAGLERENIVEHLQQLRGRQAPPPFELGALSTAWTRVRATTSASALLEEVRASAWGEVTGADPPSLRDALTAAWLHRVAHEVPSARPWATVAALLLVARSQVLEGRPVPSSAITPLDALLGRGWHAARSLDELRRGVDVPARGALDSVGPTEQLWTAEARLWTTQLAGDGRRLLRGPMPGTQPVVGAIAVLAADAFAVRAALAAVVSGHGAEEVLGDAP
jgi:hypothetical protein